MRKSAPYDKDTFIQMYHHGDMLKDIAQHFQRSIGWVQYQARELGLYTHRKPRQNQFFNKEEFIKLRLGGASYEAIGQHFGKSTPWACRKAASLGIAGRALCPKCGHPIESGRLGLSRDAPSPPLDPEQILNDPRRPELLYYMTKPLP